MIDCVINIKDERREEVINKNESDENEMFFISSMIDCVIDVEDKRREEVIDRNELSEKNKNENNITEKHISITTKTF